MTRTAADICRERGWGEGTVIHAPFEHATPWEILALGDRAVFARNVYSGNESVIIGVDHDWQEYDPDADLVGAMDRAFRSVPGNIGVPYWDAVLATLRERRVCLHPDHQGDLEELKRRHENTLLVLDAYKAHHEQFHLHCNVVGPADPPREQSR